MVAGEGASESSAYFHATKYTSRLVAPLPTARSVEEAKPTLYGGRQLGLFRQDLINIPEQRVARGAPLASRYRPINLARTPT